MNPGNLLFIIMYPIPTATMLNHVISSCKEDQQLTINIRFIFSISSFYP
jgi:hypothetical protein